MNSSQWESPAMECIVMSYDVMGQDLIGSNIHLYGNYHLYKKRWELRFDRLVKNVSDVKPTILCLQELQSFHLSQSVSELEELNLTHHIYKKRTSDDCTDGCAIFYDSKVLTLLEAHPIEYFRPDVPVI